MYIKRDKVRIKRIVLDLHDVIADSKKFKKSITYINGLSVYAYWVRRDCLKCAVLCYTFGRWEFELSTRKFMELKITKDLKSGDEIKKLLFWNKIKKVYHFAWFLLSFNKHYEYSGTSLH